MLKHCVVAVALVCCLCSSVAAQQHPTREASEAVLRRVTSLHNQIKDNREVELAGHTIGIRHLCRDLKAKRDASFRSSTSIQTNAAFDGVTLTTQQCVDALQRGATTMETSVDDLNHWSAWHCGTWWSDLTSGQTDQLGRTYFVDPAIWYRTREHTEVPRGQRQPVVWPNRACDEARNGFNQLGDDFLWGFDPKNCEELEARVNAGSSLGYELTPTTSDGHCIVWIAPNEAFLECVNRATGKKTSAGVNYGWESDGSMGGHGQWTLGHDRCGATVVHFEHDMPAANDSPADGATVSVSELRAALAAVKSASGSFALFGHASRPGEDDYNEDLTGRRAEFVAHHLQRGVDGESGVASLRLADAAFVPEGCTKVRTGVYSCGRTFATHDDAASRTVEIVFAR